MNAISTIAFDNLVQTHNHEVTTTSKIVADTFEKLHKNVLSKIEQLSLEIPLEWYQRNFTLIQIKTDLGQNRSRLDKAYEMTKDGFMLLVMGFTGKKAMEIKIKFIQAFNWALDQIHKTDSHQREILVKACSKLAIGNMLISDVYLMVGKQFGYDGGIKDIPTPLLPEAVAFVYEMILRLKPSNSSMKNELLHKMTALGLFKNQENSRVLEEMQKTLTALDYQVKEITRNNASQFSAFETLDCNIPRNLATI